MSHDLLALVAAALAASGLAILRAVHPRGAGVTPLGVYLVMWWIVIVAYLWNPLGFIPLQARTWEMIALGAGGCSAGYALVSGLLARTESTTRRASVPADDDRTLLRLWCGCAVLAGLLFAVFCAQLLRTYGVGTVAGLLFSLRSDLGAGSVPLGFHFFYFAEPLVALSVLCAARFPAQRARYASAAGVVTLALLSTSGRTNASKAILWAGVALLLHAGRQRVTFRLAAAMASGLALLLIVFLSLGSLIGKTYENSPVYAKFGTDPPVPAGLTLPYLYLTAPLPTLDRVIATGGSSTTRGSSLRPLYQVGALVDLRVRVPEKIQEFQATPYPFNVSTSVGPLYEDYGSGGVAVGSALTGGLLALMYWSWRTRPSAATLLLCALACVMAVTSTGDAVLNNLSYLIQAALFAVADRFVAPRWATGVHHRRHADRPLAEVV